MTEKEIKMNLIQRQVIGQFSPLPHVYFGNGNPANPILAALQKDEQRAEQLKTRLQAGLTAVDTFLTHNRQEQLAGGKDDSCTIRCADPQEMAVWGRLKDLGIDSLFRWTYNQHKGNLSSAMAALSRELQTIKPAYLNKGQIIGEL